MEILTDFTKNTIPPTLENDFKDILNSNYKNFDKAHTNEDTAKIKEISDKKTKEIEQELNNVATSLNFDLKFQIHKESGKIYAKIIDKNSHKVIKEIPPQSFLDFLSKFEKMIGVLFDKKS